MIGSAYIKTVRGDNYSPAIIHAGISRIVGPTVTSIALIKSLYSPSSLSSENYITDTERINFPTHIIIPASEILVLGKLFSFSSVPQLEIGLSFSESMSIEELESQMPSFFLVGFISHLPLFGYNYLVWSPQSVSGKSLVGFDYSIRNLEDLKLIEILDKTEGIVGVIRISEAAFSLDYYNVLEGRLTVRESMVERISLLTSGLLSGRKSFRVDYSIENLESLKLIEDITVIPEIKGIIQLSKSLPLSSTISFDHYYSDIRNLILAKSFEEWKITSLLISKSLSTEPLVRFDYAFTLSDLIKLLKDFDIPPPAQGGLLKKIIVSLLKPQISSF